jgi:DNA-binding transcriptional MocR family regulator
MSAMTPERREQLLALAEVHDAWVQAKLPDTPFDPDSRPDSADYNVHYVDLDGDDDDFHTRAMAAVAA